MATLASTHKRRSMAARQSRARRRNEYRLSKGEARFLIYVATLGDASTDLSRMKGFRFQSRTIARLLEKGLLEHTELPVGDGTTTRAAVVLTPDGVRALSRWEVQP